MSLFVLDVEGYPVVTGHLELPIPSGLYQVRGDEDIFGMPRVNLPDWDTEHYGEQAPAVHRYSPKPEADPTEYTVRLPNYWITEYLRINDNDPKKQNKVLAKGTALFNSRTGEINEDWGFPVQSCLVMSTNLLKPLEVSSGYLKFATLTPTQDVSHMTAESHPWFVHRFAIVTPEGRYIDPTVGTCRYFLVSKEGYGYVPLSWSKPV